MKIEKGQHGYIKKEKKRLLCLTIAEFAVVAALLILGYTQTGSKRNVLTLVAILGCLPASKMLTEWIAMVSYHTMEQDKFKETEEKTTLLTTVYDLILTSRERVMPVDALVITEHTICGYAAHKKADAEQTASYIKKVLQENRYEKVTVKIFTDYTAFLTRAEGLNNIAQVSGQEHTKRENAMGRCILAMAM